MKLVTIAALDRAAGNVNLRGATDFYARQLCADLLWRVQNPPEPDDQGVPASCTKGPRKPAGGAVVIHPPTGEFQNERMV
jgi:hypothetical protein